MMLARKPRPVLEYHAKPKATGPAIPDTIVPNLFLTDIFTARAVLLPTYPGPGRPVIRYILSALDNSLDQPKPKVNVRQNEFIQKLIIIDDTPGSDLLGILQDACDFVETSMAKDDGGVLVHCHLGQSRSASIIIAYIMRRDKLDYQAALDKVKKKRSSVRPNFGFQKQLQLWAEMNYDIHDADGKPKDQYTAWKIEQRERVQRLLADL